MAIVVIVICIILWLFIQAHMTDQGQASRSRGSFRYQRRKARKLGLDAEDAAVKPGESSWTPPEATSGSHVSNLASGLFRSLLMIIFIVLGGFFIMRGGYDGGWFFAWIAFLAVAFWVFGKYA